ncbi:MAG: DUF378 domain-containing protein [Alphaproteobacteria bacterium]|nr:DUF378 domain-containing protein [Alphaproteobacteria bacterium]
MTFVDYLRIIALIFTIIGALNWGFIGLQGVDLVGQLFGPMTALSRTIYTLVGASGVYLLCIFKRLL